MSDRDLLGDGFEPVEPATSTTRRPADDRYAHPLPRDHNHPPGLLTGDDLRISVETEFADLLAKADELIASEERVPKGDAGALFCPDDAWEAKLTDIVRKMQAFNNSLDTARKARKAPYDEASEIIHNLFRRRMDAMVDPRPRGLNGYKHRVEGALTVYKSARRLAAQRAAERAAERARWIERIVFVGAFLSNLSTFKTAADAADAADLLAEKARGPKTNATANAAAATAAAAAAMAQQSQAGIVEAAAPVSGKRAVAERVVATPAAALTQRRGDTGLSSMREYVDARDVDRNTIDLEKLRQHLPIAAIEQAVRAYGAANSDMIKGELANNRQPVRGVTYFIHETTHVTG